MHILVIGSKGHARARCVDWLQPYPNVEEFDAVILNMTSYTQAVIDKLVAKGPGPNPVRQLADTLQTLLRTGRNVYAIFVPKVSASPLPTQKGAFFQPIQNNWDWLPVYPILAAKEGTSLGPLVESDLKPYFDKVGEWRYELFVDFKTTINDAGNPSAELAAAVIGGYLSKKTLLWKMRGVAYNKSQNMISARIASLSGSQGGIYLLPPPTKCTPHDGIEIIIDITSGTRQAGFEFRPEWWERVPVPMVPRIEQEIQAKARVVEEQLKAVEVLKQQKEDAESYRRLLSETDTALVQAVWRALKDIGIETDPTEKGFPADLMRKGEIAVEVTGIRDKVASDSPKIAQLMRLKEGHSTGEKVVLVANTHRLLDPAQRKGLMDFSEPAASLFQSQGVCALTTLTLFTLWSDVMTGKRKPEEVKSLIMKTVGILVPPQ